jgi:hypothetical protein
MVNKGYNILVKLPQISRLVLGLKLGIPANRRELFHIIDESGLSLRYHLG